MKRIVALGISYLLLSASSCRDTRRSTYTRVTHMDTIKDTIQVYIPLYKAKSDTLQMPGIRLITRLDTITQTLRLYSVIEKPVRRDSLITVTVEKPYLVEKKGSEGIPVWAFVSVVGLFVVSIILMLIRVRL